MNKFSKSMRNSVLVTAILAASSSYSHAGPIIGFDPTGTGDYTTYADLWTNVTDTGLTTGFSFGSVIPGEDRPYTTTFTAQTVVGTMSDSNVPSIVTPSGLNSLYEITKTLKLDQLVISQEPGSATFVEAPGQYGGVAELNIYFDDITDGSKAVPGNGSGTVSCYGGGITSVGCGSTEGDLDGELILSAQLLELSADFSLSDTDTGNGSFQIWFEIDYANTDYIDLVEGDIFGELFAGTLVFPSFFTPDTVWDGTPLEEGVAVRFDSSQNFQTAPVSEPTSLALMSLSLLLMGGFIRKQRS